MIGKNHPRRIDLIYMKIPIFNVLLHRSKCSFLCKIRHYFPQIGMFKLSRPFPPGLKLMEHKSP